MGLYNTKLFLPPPLLPSPRPLSQLKQKTTEIIKKIKKPHDGILVAYCCLSCAFQQTPPSKLFKLSCLKFVWEVKEGRMVWCYRNPIKIMCTTRLNDGIFFIRTWNSFWRFMRLWVFFGFVGTTGVLSASVSDFVVWDGGITSCSISLFVASKN
jgi:hypothetical protein